MKPCWKGHVCIFSSSLELSASRNAVDQFPWRFPNCIPFAFRPTRSLLCSHEHINQRCPANTWTARTGGPTNWTQRQSDQDSHVHMAPFCIDVCRYDSSNHLTISNIAHCPGRWYSDYSSMGIFCWWPFIVYSKNAYMACSQLYFAFGRFFKRSNPAWLQCRRTGVSADITGNYQGPEPFRMWYVIKHMP